MVRKLVMVAIGLAVLVLTPYFLYSGDDPDVEFQFGEAEMRAAVEGTWIVKLTPKQGPARSILFTVEQWGPTAHSSRERGWIRSAAACGRRSFIKRAEACVDISNMELKLVAIGDARSSTLSGRFHVFGKRFDRGGLHLDIDGSRIEATIAARGEVLDISMRDGSAWLMRVQRPGEPAPAPGS